MSKAVKLDRDNKVGLFLIKIVRGLVNYELDLPAKAKIHQIFHISLLEPTDSNTPLQEIFYHKNKEDNEYVAKKILQQNGQRYLIKWEGCLDLENTREPKEHLTNCSLRVSPTAADKAERLSERSDSVLGL